MEEDEKIKAYIMKEILDKDEFSQQELRGVNDFLEYLTLDTLKVIADDIVMGYSSESR